MLMVNLNEILAEKRQPFEVECYEVLKEEGFQLMPYYYVQSIEDLEQIIPQLDDRKYVLKVMSPKIIHKSDFQAVLLNISKNNIVDKYKDLESQFNNLDFRGVLIVPMASDGIELLVGSAFDPTFGLITIFGIGGTLVEVVKDVTFAKAPISNSDAQLMINSLKNQELLNGPRGLPKLDKIEMAEFLVRFSKMSCKYSDLIKEIDLNPVRITAEGLFPLDARIIFHPDKC